MVSVPGLAAAFISAFWNGTFGIFPQLQPVKRADVGACGPQSSVGPMHLSLHAVYGCLASARPCVAPLLQPEPYIFNFWASVGVVMSSLPLFVVYPMVSICLLLLCLILKAWIVAVQSAKGLPLLAHC